MFAWRVPVGKPIWILEKLQARCEKSWTISNPLLIKDLASLEQDEGPPAMLPTCLRSLFHEEAHRGRSFIRGGGFAE